MKDRIKKLMGNGLKASEVATIVGCSPGYISQLLKDESFLKEVEAALLENQQGDSEEEHLVKRYERIEHRILNKMEDAMEGAELPQLTRALETIGKRKDEMRKPHGLSPSNPLGAGTVNNGTVNLHITQIALPAHAIKSITPVIEMNSNNEIISINNKPLAPMSSSAVKNIFEQMNPNRTQILPDPKTFEVSNDVLSEL